MNKTISTFVAEPFTNSIGQTINPGDSVAYVTHSRARVSMGKGRFDGVYKDSNGGIFFTKISGIRNSKYVATGKTITQEYNNYEYCYETKTYKPVLKTYTYHEHVSVPCEPYGSTLLQCHRIIKIEG